MSHAIRRRSGRAASLLIVGVVAVLATGVFVTSRLKKAGANAVDETVLLHTVNHERFEAYIVEPGDVASSSNVEIRCRVRSRGTVGTAMLNICDERAFVKK